MQTALLASTAFSHIVRITKGYNKKKKNMVRRHFLLHFFCLFGFSCFQAQARFVTGCPSPTDLVSDGIFTVKSPPYLLLKPLASAEVSCKQTYGFLPCNTTALGNLFLILVYGYLIYLAATYLLNGSDVLLEILGPGVVGGLPLPVLRALPNAMLILVSGLSGTTETAQSQVSIGMGMLAGSTIMFLTVVWGSCVVVGRCDLRDSVAVDGTITKGFSLTETGVGTDIWTCYAARIMAISVIPFIIVQLSQILNSTLGRQLAVLIALIVSLSMLVSYCLYQVFQPWIQRRRLAFAKHKLIISGILRHFEKTALGKLLDENGDPNREILRKLFQTIDENHDGSLSTSELKAFIIGIRFEEVDLDKDDAVRKLMADIDTSLDSRVQEEEFVRGIAKWIIEAKRTGGAYLEPNKGTFKLIDHFHQQTQREHDLLGSEEQSDEVVEGVENPGWTSLKAVLMLLLGTLIAAAFADPLIDAVDNFSDATSIPSFFISFVALPLASNSRVAVQAIICASRKKKRTASLTLSELYATVTMNNVLCLSVFLALVYTRGLTWDFSSEVLVICIVCIVMGAFASFRTTFPLWTCSVASVLYPFSLALVYVLVYVFGWS